MGPPSQGAAYPGRRLGLRGQMKERTEIDLSLLIGTRWNRLSWGSDSIPDLSSNVVVRICREPILADQYGWGALLVADLTD